MKKVTTLTVVLALIICFPVISYADNRGIGGILGGILGGVIGSKVGKGKGKTAATIGGALIGVLIGSEVGRQLDERDKELMDKKTQEALEKSKSGHPNVWVNPDNGHDGIITPGKAGRDSNGRYCREFQQEIRVDGRTERAYGKACREPDGSWKITEQIK
ncbi:MAG: hypothetical protein A2835_01225 [Candidatus Niyogibacteria bacterium RIFCSPHIGHO2_01_FULL_45_28]|uniref:17 kDa surface antigen n=1 Tax=Candidatus Niyogibacteria bacterium RIFCSPLOWO2_02_FULL_45_13 TaxID=1801725 RepID=A0A1G2EZP3_9BACT|nr:MAG: hypothetical protein A2835_01225 [Candidatus Niyogibacteria bacterium RIFCSPHIGHO2_01_FULL_45_28]OGZ31269.1 MAG: hypothetical protein A3J00_01175 [Candidatus Niyogibacteria bacterium RIFCSPLOWO2_02_FULL_45_13]